MSGEVENNKSGEPGLSSPRDRIAWDGLHQIHHEFGVDIVGWHTPPQEALVVFHALRNVLHQYVNIPEGEVVNPRVVDAGLSLMTEAFVRSHGLEGLSPEDRDNTQHRGDITARRSLAAPLTTAEGQYFVESQASQQQGVKYE